MDACCDLGRILQDNDRVLFRSDNFYVASTIGQMGIEGYLLILSNKCYKGTGDIPERLHGELDEVTKLTKKVLKSVYGVDSQVFEHGPRVCGVRGGGCLDHAHLHVVPGVDIMDDLALDLMHRLESIGQFYRVDRTEGFKRTMEIFNNQKCSYLIAESPDDKRMVVEVNHHIPSQYMRRMVGDKVKAMTWDWAVDPDYETMNRTVERLSGKF